MAFRNRDSFTSSFPISMPFISLSCLIYILTNPSGCLDENTPDQDQEWSKSPGKKGLCLGPGGSKRKVTKYFRVFLFCSSLL